MEKITPIAASLKVVEISRYISDLVHQTSPEWCFGAKDALRAALDDIPHLLTACEVQFSDDTQIEGLLDSISGIMTFREGMVRIAT